MNFTSTRQPVAGPALRALALSQRGAFDLPSIITGVVVVGVLTAGVLGSVFGVIPFAQDNGAKQDAAAVRTAEGVARAKGGRFLDTAGLIAAGYLPSGLSAPTAAGESSFVRVASTASMTYAAAVNDAGSCYVAVTRSGTGKTFYVTDTAPQPAELTPLTDTGCLPSPQVQPLVSSIGGYQSSYIPAPPGNLTGTVASPTSAKFTWDTSGMAAGYKVESRINAGPWKTEAENQVERSFTVTGSANDAISVRVTALNAAGSSASAPDATVTLPADPRFRTLTVTKQGAKNGAAGVPNWRSVASSADGMKLVAGRNDTSSVHTSVNGGTSWAIHSPASGAWESVASSADGTRLIAGYYGNPLTPDGLLYTSSDSGMTWTQRSHVGMWNTTASSGDGRVLFASGRYSYMASMSTDYGVTWRDFYIGGSKYVQEAAISGDGSVLMAGNTSALYVSKDGGATWVEQTQVGAGNWGGMAVSADGSTMIAGNSESTGALFISHDRGATWTKQDKLAPMAWNGMSVSADGTKMAAAGGNQIYTSIDSGATWKLQPGFGSGWFNDVVSSADGTKIFALEYTGPLYTGIYGP